MVSGQWVARCRTHAATACGQGRRGVWGGVGGVGRSRRGPPEGVYGTRPPVHLSSSPVCKGFPCATCRVLTRVVWGCSLHVAVSDTVSPPALTVGANQKDGTGAT